MQTINQTPPLTEPTIVAFGWYEADLGRLAPQSEITIDEVVYYLPANAVLTSDLVLSGSPYLLDLGDFIEITVTDNFYGEDGGLVLASSGSIVINDEELCAVLAYDSCQVILGSDYRLFGAPYSSTQQSYPLLGNGSLDHTFAAGTPLWDYRYYVDTAPLGSVYPGTTFTFDANDTSNIGLPKCSTPKNVSILEYIWDFGNGQTASGPLASITYNPGLGDFQVSVRLTVTDSLGRVSSAAQIVNLSSSGFARTNL